MNPTKKLNPEGFIHLI